ncbi:class I SAM-dependent methyltransferase [Deinococcus sp.]|uniref:class I SAM-dependent rRNA methyltransferase n=1 Tax=Deinococcus sp. TaxID=47478 RepID=UPI0025E60737|nr:class I SAM-dependent methyltransferase [Deinococcus sp.]
MDASSALLPADPAGLLARLHARRAHLPAQGTTVYRAAHTTETGGLLALDVAGSVGILSLYAGLSAEQEAALGAACGVIGLESVYLKRRPREASHAANTEREYLAPLGPLWGEARPELTALEAGVPLLIRPGADLSIGIFTDARAARQWVRTHTPPGGRVLNTFAYTCGFGLSAALAGALSVKNVDLSRKVLAWGQENYALSGLDAPDTDFLYGDVFDWLTRLARRGERFELVILDPPSFARNKHGVWRSEQGYARLLAQAAAVAAPGGQVLALCNHAGMTGAAFEAQLRLGAAQAGRTVSVTASFGAGEDYPGATHLKVRALRLD